MTLHERAALETSSRSRLPAEADRPWAILLSAQVRPSPAIAEVVAVAAARQRLSRLKRRAEAGELELLFADETDVRPILIWHACGRGSPPIIPGRTMPTLTMSYN